MPLSDSSLQKNDTARRVVRHTLLKSVWRSERANRRHSRCNGSGIHRLRTVGTTYDISDASLYLRTLIFLRKMSGNYSSSRGPSALRVTCSSFVRSCHSRGVTARESDALLYICAPYISQHYIWPGIYPPRREMPTNDNPTPSFGDRHGQFRHTTTHQPNTLHQYYSSS